MGCASDCKGKNNWKTKSLTSVYALYQCNMDCEKTRHMNNMNSRMSDSYCILLFRSLTNSTNTYTVLFSIRYLASTFTIKILSSRLNICPSFSFITTSGPFTTPLSCLSNTSSTGYCKTEQTILAVPHYSWKKL